MLDAEKGFLLRNAGALAPLFWWMRLPFGRYGLGSVQTLRTKKLFKHIALLAQDASTTSDVHTLDVAAGRRV